MTSSGSVKAITAPQRFAAEAGVVITAVTRQVVDEAVEAGERIPYGFEAYFARVVGQRAPEKLRSLFERCWRDGFGHGRGDG